MVLFVGSTGVLGSMGAGCVCMSASVGMTSGCMLVSPVVMSVGTNRLSGTGCGGMRVSFGTGCDGGRVPCRMGLRWGRVPSWMGFGWSFSRVGNVSSLVCVA